MKTHSILTITESAQSAIIDAMHDSDFKILKIGIKRGGCSGFEYTMEYVSEKDKFDEKVSMPFSEEKDISVVIDKKALMYLMGSEMDYATDDKLQSGFVFRNPNSKGECGCGKSFNA